MMSSFETPQIENCRYLDRLNNEDIDISLVTTVFVDRRSSHFLFLVLDMASNIQIILEMIRSFSLQL